MAAGALLATHTLAGQAAGMFFRLFGTACLNITLSLYILDHIPKQDLVRSEPLRLALSTASWTVGPYLGVYLYARHGVWSPFVLSIVAAALVLRRSSGIFGSREFIIKPARQAPAQPVEKYRIVYFRSRA